jgi:hypothetical protein
MKMIHCLRFVFILSLLISFNEYAIGQTPAPILTQTPVIPVVSTPVRPKKQISISTSDDQPFPVSMKEAHEADEQKIKELKEKEQTKTIGVHGTGKGWGKPLPPPLNFEIKPGKGLAYLSWDAVPGASQYFVYSSEDGKKYERRIYSPLKETHIEIGNLYDGKTYYFAVSAFGNREGLRAIQTVTLSAPK